MLRAEHGKNGGPKRMAANERYQMGIFHYLISNLYIIASTFDRMWMWMRMWTWIHSGRLFGVLSWRRMVLQRAPTRPSPAPTFKFNHNLFQQLLPLALFDFLMHPATLTTNNASIRFLIHCQNCQDDGKQSKSPVVSALCSCFPPLQVKSIHVIFFSPTLLVVLRFVLFFSVVAGNSRTRPEPKMTDRLIVALLACNL